MFAKVSDVHTSLKIVAKAPIMFGPIDFWAIVAETSDINLTTWQARVFTNVSHVHTSLIFVGPGTHNLLAN